MMLAVQAGLAAHPIGHANQQVDVTCTVCAFDGYVKAMPPLPDSIQAQAAACDTPATRNCEPTISVVVGLERIRGPPGSC